MWSDNVAELEEVCSLLDKCVFAAFEENSQPLTFSHRQNSLQALQPSCGELLSMLVKSVAARSAVAYNCKNFRRGSPTCRDKQRSEQEICCLRTLAAPSLQTLTVTSVCVGSGSINIPVLCMLVSGDATMLEVQPSLLMLNDFSQLLI